MYLSAKRADEMLRRGWHMIKDAEASEVAARWEVVKEYWMTTTVRGYHKTVFMVKGRKC